MHASGATVRQTPSERLKIAVVGTGISGIAAAWLLSSRHDVTVYERAERIGGHANTVDARTPRGSIPVDTGFIVYNEQTYPNLTALFAHFQLPTGASEMSFSVSLGDGDLEYSGGNLGTLFAQKRNILRPRFWLMLFDLRRFYRDAPAHMRRLGSEATLGDYLKFGNYGDAFRDDHLLPMAAAIWSAPAKAMLDYPAAAFIRFHDNHGLLKLKDRPVWRTVRGGSRAYVARLTKAFADRIR
ncbi:MAG: NAD(P)/FAD-dependent oxidoreductase, partial [Candidatus Binataceae bacterium]